jgi:hypothetical protein
VIDCQGNSRLLLSPYHLIFVKEGRVSDLVLVPGSYWEVTSEHPDVQYTDALPPDGDSGQAERLFRREAERHSGMVPNTIGA